MTPLDPLPRGQPDAPVENPPMATSEWVPQQVLAEWVASEAASKPVSPVVVGKVALPDGKAGYFRVDDDRHIAVIAGSRAGKGESFIGPNLLSYPGSVVAIDPKGENAAISAAYRAEKLGQQVVVLDPFGVTVGTKAEPYRKTFNPLDWVSTDEMAIDETAFLADAFALRDGHSESHWHETSRALLKGLLLHILAHRAEGMAGAPEGSFALLRHLVTIGDPDPELTTKKISPQQALLRRMIYSKAFNGVVASTGYLLDQMGDNERGSVLSTARRHTEFLDSPAIARNMTRSEFNPSDLKRNPKGMTIYLVLPEWLMATHARWLRLNITTFLQVLQRTPKPAPDAPAVLFILDEYASLGHMDALERAAGYIAGFGVKLAVILQDLSQLKRLYPQGWETFLGNAGILIAFGNADLTSTEYLSRRAGQTEITRTLPQVSQQSGESVQKLGAGPVLGEIMRGHMPWHALGSQGGATNSGVTVSTQPQLHRTALINPDEVTRYFARETNALMLLLAGAQPIRLQRVRYHEDSPFRERASPNPFYATPKKAA